MTLVAGLSLGGMPAFIGDLLVSWRLPTKIELPTRQRQEVAEGINKNFAAGLAQKLLIVRPYLLVAWAGEVSVVHKLVRDLDEALSQSIDDLDGREDELLGRLDALPESVELVAVLIAEDSIWPICVHTRGFELDQKRFYLLGTGNETIFEFLVHMTSGMPMPDNPDGMAARMTMLNFAANAMMAQYQSGYGLFESWGGGFEIAYPTRDGFRKLENILVRCWSLNGDGLLGNIGTSFLIHYQGPTLLLSSFGEREITTMVSSPIGRTFAAPIDKEIVPEWTIDLFHRASDGMKFHAVQMEYPWSKPAKFFFKDGNIVAWEMEKGRIDKIIEKIDRGFHRPFNVDSL